MKDNITCFLAQNDTYLKYNTVLMASYEGRGSYPTLKSQHPIIPHHLPSFPLLIHDITLVCKKRTKYNKMPLKSAFSLHTVTWARTGVKIHNTLCFLYMLTTLFIFWASHTSSKLPILDKTSCWYHAFY